MELFNITLWLLGSSWMLLAWVCEWVQFHWHWDRKHGTSVRTKFIPRQSDKSRDWHTLYISPKRTHMELEVEREFCMSSLWCSTIHKVEHRGARFPCLCANVSVYVQCLVEDSDEWLWYFCGSHALNRSQLYSYNGVTLSRFYFCLIWFAFFAMVQSVLNTMVPNTGLANEMANPSFQQIPTATGQTKINIPLFS